VQPASPEWTEDIVYAFDGANEGGANPFAGVTAGGGGVLYGVTSIGGGSGCKFGAGCGTVFQLRPSQHGYVLSVLHAFSGGSQEVNSFANALVRSKEGALFGTTRYGGSSDCTQGCGTVFELVPGSGSYTEYDIHVFKDRHDGAFPLAGLLLSADGSLYGTSAAGTACAGNPCGSVFQLTPKGSSPVEPDTKVMFDFSVLYGFKDIETSGYDSRGSVIEDKSGSLYGTTFYGGNGTCPGGCGTVFKITPTAKNPESILYSFQGGNFGIGPWAGLVSDQYGALYGTTAYGGGGPCTMMDEPNGCGSVFKLTPSGSGYAYAQIYSFQGSPDGATPESSLVIDSAGRLYGTTVYGGKGTNCPYIGTAGCGTAFELEPSRSGYVEHIIHSFKGPSSSGPSDGAFPFGSLLASKNNVLFGTTYIGGEGEGGIVFKLSP
jgi:uncharacterized repeat protein (TIGR03803 family)